MNQETDKNAGKEEKLREKSARGITYHSAGYYLLSQVSENWVIK